jgi:hypothetical protein
VHRTAHGEGGRGQGTTQSWSAWNGAASLVGEEEEPGRGTALGGF